MRIWHRFKTLMPLLLTITMAAEASAQNMASYASFDAPAYSAGPPQGYPTSAAQGMPSSFQSHPMISPFDHAFEQHFSSDGLWFKRVLSGMSNMNDYYFNIDYTKTKTRTLRGLFGDPSTPTFDQQAILANTATGRNAAVTFPDALTLPTFPQQNVGQLGANINQGIRLSGGIKNQLGWRFAWNVGYNGSSTDVFDVRANVPRLHATDTLFLSATGGQAAGSLPGNLLHINERSVVDNQILGARVFDDADADDYGVLGSTSEILDRNLYPHGAIGIRTGESPAPGVPDAFGTNQLFDLDFILKHEVKSYGAGFHFAATPLYEKGSFQIRPIIGGRYFNLTEGIAFTGVDSGLEYTANVPNGLDDDDDFVIDNVIEGGTDNFTDPVEDETVQILVRSFINSNVRSSMAGPEAGIEYEVAKKKAVTFYGSTRVGALLNAEKMDLAGDNIGNTSSVAVDQTDPNGIIRRDQMNDTTTLNGRVTENFFSDSNTSTHVSPMFEQSLTAELPIFSRIPVLRDCWQLEHAKLRLGWTYTWIGEVADPNQSIVWLSNPVDGLFPHLNIQRSDFFQNQFNVGIHWTF